MDLLLALDPRLREIIGEDAFKYFKKACEWEKATGKKVIHTEIGQLEYEVPSAIEKHMALDNSRCGYSLAQGLAELRDIGAQYMSDRAGVKVEPEEIIITPGAKPGITAAIRAFVNYRPKKIVAYPEPGYPPYFGQTLQYSGLPHPLYLTPENNFRMNPKDFEKVAPQTSLLIICSPGNPTGSVLSDEELEEFAGIAYKHQVPVLSDEAYLEFNFSGRDGQPAPTILNKPHMLEQSLIIQGASKTFALMGGRVGYFRAPKQIVPYLTTFLGNIYSHTATNMQRAVQAALIELLQEKEGGFETNTYRWLKALRENLRDLRDFIHQGLCKIKGINHWKPQGAFYFWIDISQTGLNDEEFADRFLKEYYVSVLPGRSFGKSGKNYIRICFGSIRGEESKELIQRLKSFIESLQN